MAQSNEWAMGVKEERRNEEKERIKSTKEKDVQIAGNVRVGCVCVHACLCMGVA
jgi:hypothetical protein